MINLKHSFKRSTVITALIGAFLFGLLLGHFYLWQVHLVVIAITLIFSIAVYKTRLLLPAVVVLGLALGIWRGFGSLQSYAALQNLFGQKITLTGTVLDDPSVSDTGFLNFSLSDLRQDGRPLAGQIRVRGRYMKMQRGYQISAKGKLEATIGNKQGQFGFADVKALSDKQSWLEQLRQRFFAGMRTALPEPLASLALGLLVGTRALIPKPLADALTAVGLSHIIAVSGYNLTIIAGAVRRPLGKLSRYLSTVLTLWLILAFMVVSGFSASIVRAGIVSVLALVAAYYGRKVRPLVLIALAAGSTAAYRPDYLWSDLGWQLSFLAFFGIMVLGPAIEKRWVKKPNAIKSLFVESMAAQVMTFPLILLVFGRVSAAGPFTNLLVLPLLPAAMLLSFVAGLAGMLVPLLCGWFAWPAVWLLELILAIVSWFARQGWSNLKFGTTWPEVAVFYGGVILILLILNIVVSRHERLESTDAS